jgi:hypothetical protein
MYEIRRNAPSERNLTMLTNCFHQRHLPDRCHRLHPRTVLTIELLTVEIAHANMTVRMETGSIGLPAMHETNLTTYPDTEGKEIILVLTDICHWIMTNFSLIVYAT